MIPYGRQDISQADVDSVVDVLRSDFLTQGPAVPLFEQAVATKVGANHAVAVNSATSALHIACLALDLGPGDELWTVPNTFVASANCGRYCGASVDFVDIDPLTLNLSVPKLREKLEKSKAANRLPKVLVPVHFSGQPTDQEEIWELAEEFGFRVLEDASHAIGASRHSEPVGSCRWSHITVFSFHPVKIITSGEGGMALTNDSDLAERMTLFRSHGISRDPEKFLAFPSRMEDSLSPEQPAPPWYYEQQVLGYNYRITDIQAALGTQQLERLDEFVSRRNELANRYLNLLRGLRLRLPTVLQGNRSSFHLFVVQVLDQAGSKSRNEVFDELRRHGIGVNVHYLPVHLQPYFQELSFNKGQFPVAEQHGASGLTLPLYSAMTDLQQDQVVSALKEIL